MKRFAKMILFLVASFEASSWAASAKPGFTNQTVKLEKDQVFVKTKDSPPIPVSSLGISFVNGQAQLKLITGGRIIVIKLNPEREPGDVLARLQSAKNRLDKNKNEKLTIVLDGDTRRPLDEADVKIESSLLPFGLNVSNALKLFPPPKPNPALAANKPAPPIKPNNPQ